MDSFRQNCVKNTKSHKPYGMILRHGGNKSIINKNPANAGFLFIRYIFLSNSFSKD